MVYGVKEILFSSLHRTYLISPTFSVSTNFHIRKANHEDLEQMSIVELHFDKGYDHFLVLRLLSDTTTQQKVIVY